MDYLISASIPPVKGSSIPVEKKNGGKQEKQYTCPPPKHTHTGREAGMQGEKGEDYNKKGFLRAWGFSIKGSQNQRAM